MKARIYTNENFDHRVVAVLRAKGHDVLTSLDADRANRRIPDDEVLDYARDQGRAVLTFNRLHFLRLHKLSEGAHSGIVVCSTDPDFEALADRIDQALREAQSLVGQLLRINRPVR